eukprot:Amastigsp_a262_287.p3 type:complete len:125 gc:universal Amastigsp_a262_287:536-162(-)
MRGSCVCWRRYRARSAAFSSSVSGSCFGTSECSVMLTMSSVSKKISKETSLPASCATFLASAVMFPEMTRMPCFTSAVLSFAAQLSSSFEPTLPLRKKTMTFSWSVCFETITGLSCASAPSDAP